MLDELLFEYWIKKTKTVPAEWVIPSNKSVISVKVLLVDTLVPVVLLDVTVCITAPATSYTASGTTLTFQAAPVSGTNNIYVIFRNFAIPSAGGPSLANNNSFAGVNNFAQPLVNSGTIASDITIASGERAMMAGDISINSSTTVTVNGVLTIV